MIALLKRREARPKPPKKQFTLDDFVYDEENETCFCPAGQKLYKSGTDMQFNGYGVAHLKAPPSPPALAVPFAASVYGTPSGHGSASSLVIKDRVGRPPPTKAKVNAVVERMRRKFDTPAGRATYSKRIGTVEPVFGNILNKGMRRS